MYDQVLNTIVGAGALVGLALQPGSPAPTVTPKPVVVEQVAAKPADSAPESRPAPKVVEVQPGDSLTLIAEVQGLESWRPLWNANPELVSPDTIYPGQKLVVPDGPTADRPLPAAPQPVSQPVRQPARAVSGPKPAANYAPGAGGVLERIRMRESGGNYATNTGNGYYGAYQFDLRTWRGVGGAGLPSEASPAEQDMRAQMLYDRRGCNPWPNTCY